MTFDFTLMALMFSTLVNVVVLVKVMSLRLTAKGLQGPPGPPGPAGPMGIQGEPCKCTTMIHTPMGVE